MEGRPDFKEPSEKKIIIDDLASYEEEIGVGRQVRRRGGFMDFLKNLFVGLLLIGIVIGSFWVSFLLGKRVLVPVKSLQTREIAPIVESVPSIESDAEEAYLVLSTIEPEKTEPIPSKRVVPAPEGPELVKYYKVVAGLFPAKAQAEQLVSDLKDKGVTSFVKKVSSAFRVQVGAYRTRERAQVLFNELKVKGFQPSIIYE